MASAALIEADITDYSPELGEIVCKLIANSEKGLRQTLKAHGGLPSMAIVYQWRDNNPNFAVMFAQAKRRQLEAMAEDIVDTAMNEDMDPADKRLIVDTKKWLLSKLMHRQFGDKLDITSGGEALPASSQHIDQRVQSIIMQAEARRRGALEGLSDEAQSLLE